MNQNTQEQDNGIAAALTGEHVVLQAGAGCGKTYLLTEISRAKPKREQIGYLAFNRKIAAEARQKFARYKSTRVSTVHSFAYHQMKVKENYQHRLDGPRVSAKYTAKLLGITDGVSWGDHSFGPVKLALLAMGTVTRYCQSDDREITSRHVPFVPGTEAFFDQLAEIVAPFARRAWEDLIRTDGKLRFTHDIYLKMWALTNPELPFDVVELDEAQDTNPVVEGVVKRQDAQIIMVGDSAQQIYAWRGARDVMTDFDAPHRLTLSQSFRFGPAVADEANKWLELLNAPLRLKGHEPIKSVLEPLEEPRTILCRTNAQVVADALSMQEQDKKVAIVGGTREVKMFAEAARDLMSGGTTTHPELMGFENWAEVQQYVSDEAGSDLKVFVNLIDNYGVETVMNVADKAVDEKYADTIISTAHKAKGMEWESVRVSTDFKEPVSEDGEPQPPSKSECNLAYVSVTRAMGKLDRGGLSYVDKYVAREEKPSPTPKPLRQVVAERRRQRGTMGYDDNLTHRKV